MTKVIKLYDPVASQLQLQIITNFHVSPHDMRKPTLQCAVDILCRRAFYTLCYGVNDANVTNE